MSHTPTFPKMDLKSIKLLPESTPQIVRVSEADGFFLNARYNNDFRLRTDVYERLKKARRHLPIDLTCMLYEAYRPLSRQIVMWEEVQAEMKAKHPTLSQEAFEDLCETFIANPYDGIGSGHQTACAVDITLCTATGEELDMGTPMHSFSALTWTQADGLPEHTIVNRQILRNALEAEGFLNYPAEWWHYSYGDQSWAWLAGKSEAFYGPLDLPASDGQS